MQAQAITHNVKSMTRSIIYTVTNLKDSELLLLPSSVYTNKVDVRSYTLHVWKCLCNII